jgi:hypothetical protein
VHLRSQPLAIACFSLVSAASLGWALLLGVASALPLGPDAPGGPAADAAHRAALLGAGLCAGAAIVGLLGIVLLGDGRPLPLPVTAVFVVVLVASGAASAWVTRSVPWVDVARCGLGLLGAAVAPTSARRRG